MFDMDALIGLVERTKSQDIDQAAVQRLDGIVLANLGHQPGNLAVWDIGRIADDNIERLAKTIQPIVHAKLGVFCQSQRCRILPRLLHGPGRNVHAQPRCLRQVMQ